MWFEIGIGNIENSKIELNRSVLINTSHPGGIWGNIRGNKINMADVMFEEECIDSFSLKYISNRDKNIMFSKWFNFLDVSSEDFTIWTNSSCKHL